MQQLLLLLFLFLFIIIIVVGWSTCTLSNRSGKQMFLLCLCLFSTLVSGFFTILPYLVLMILSPWLMFLRFDIPFVSFPSLWLSLLSCVPIVSFCASGVILLIGFQFFMFLAVGRVDAFEYGPEWDLVDLFLYVCLIGYVGSFLQLQVLV